MSGFEIAGVVLGSLPLIISAMEHYAEGIAAAKRFWRYKSEMRSLIMHIKTEKTIFTNTLEQLLTGIVRIEHMNELLANPGGLKWQNPEVDDVLKERLRSSYPVYFENIRGMDVALKQMMKKLALDEDGKPQFTDPNAFKQEIKRLKFSISKSEYAELLTNVKNHNQALTRLTKQSLDLEPARTKDSSSQCLSFNAFQNYAKSLYNTLRAGWCCGCEGHAVNLRLESRTQLKKEQAVEKIPFRVVFSYSTDHNATSSGWPHWKEVDIRFIEEKPTLVPLSACSQNVAASVPSAPSATVKRRVRFDQVQLHVQQKTTISTSTMTQTVTSSVSPQSPADPTPDQIHDLCKVIAKLHLSHRDLCIGYLLDINSRKHGIYPLAPPMPAPNQDWAAYSLKDVLARNVNIKRRLTQQDKLKVAVDLASSVLQLYKTPWLDERWGKEDVFFIHRPGASPASIYEHPFVCRKFTTTQSTNTHVSSMPRACRVIRNQTLFTLGVLLIELWYGKSIDELQIPRDRDCTGTPGVEWCTADRLIEEEIEFEAGKRYSDAVRRCIRCDFDRKDMSLDNESFQQAVYDGVVALLEKTLQHFTGSMD